MKGTNVAAPPVADLDLPNAKGLNPPPPPPPNPPPPTTSSGDMDLDNPKLVDGLFMLETCSSVALAAHNLVRFFNATLIGFLVAADADPPTPADSVLAMYQEQT